MSEKQPITQQIRNLVGADQLAQAINLVLTFDEKNGRLFQREFNTLEKKRISGTADIEYKLANLSERIIDFTVDFDNREKLAEELKDISQTISSQDSQSHITDPFIQRMETTLSNMKTDMNKYFREAALRNKLVTYIFLEHKVQCINDFQEVLQQIAAQQRPNRVKCSQHIQAFTAAVAELDRVLLASQLSASPVYQKTKVVSKQLVSLRTRILAYLVNPQKGINTADFSLIILNLTQLNNLLKDKMANAVKYS